jgi:hypothetical protein
LLSRRHPTSIDDFWAKLRMTPSRSNDFLVNANSYNPSYKEMLFLVTKLTSDCLVIDLSLECSKHGPSAMWRIVEIIIQLIKWNIEFTRRLLLPLTHIRWFMAKMWRNGNSDSGGPEKGIHHFLIFSIFSDLELECFNSARDLSGKLSDFLFEKRPKTYLDEMHFCGLRNSEFNLRDRTPIHGWKIKVK